MYDTAAVLLSHPPERVTEVRRWDRTVTAADPATGECWPKYIKNVEDGPGLTLLPGGQLKVERSLTKALLGTNVLDLTDGQVSESIAHVDDEVRRALDVPGLPSIATWLPVRVDYAENIKLPGGEAEVLRTLGALAEVSLPRKGLPVRGQAHSVAWPTGAIRPKLYGKYLESGDQRALGILRHEVGVFRARAFRDLQAGTPSLNRPARTDSDITLVDVLTPEFRGVVLDRYRTQLRGDVMTAREIGDLELVRLLHELFGVKRSVTMMGWALTWDVMGTRTARDILATGAGSVPTRYRVVADFRRLRDEMVKRGLMIDGHDPAVEASPRWDRAAGDELVSEVITRVALLGRSAA
jgi:hypothetical protein